MGLERTELAVGCWHHLEAVDVQPQGVSEGGLTDVKLGKWLIKHEDTLGVGPAGTFTLKETKEMFRDTESREDTMLEADPN